MNLEVNKENIAPIYFMTQPPPGWLRAFKGQNRENLASSSCDLVSAQEQRWKERTGVSPEQSRFTVLVPIHNEEKALPSFLGSLMLADIPFSCPVNTVFITNDCTDQSWEIINRFLKSVGNEMTTSDLRVDDQGVRQPIWIARHKNRSFMHINTVTKGKSNALRLGNQIAISEGHDITFSLDSDTYIEPNSIALLYKEAYKNIYQDKSSMVVLLGGVANGVRRPSFQSKLSVFLGKPQRYISDRADSVSGCMMAWSTKWLSEIDGPPPVALEDYAMVVLAKAKGFEVRRIPEAQTWYYSPNNMFDNISTRTRTVRGCLQLLQMYPETIDIVQKDYHFVQKDLLNRIKAFFKNNPTALPVRLASFLLWEYSLTRGIKEYASNPSDQSWEATLSTK